MIRQRHIQRDRRRRLNRSRIAAAFGNDDLRTGRVIGRRSGIVTELSRLFTQRLHFRRLFLNTEHRLQLRVFLRKIKARHHQFYTCQRSRRSNTDPGSTCGRRTTGH
ncbi:hypothetical protein D3C81_1401180 [compost metagenome]